MDETQLQSAEEQLAHISGVESVAIDASQGEIEAIHVLADESRRPKQIVRDVISSLRTIFHISVDHKKISVVSRSVTHSIGANSGSSVDRGRSGRLQIHSVTVRDKGSECEAEVVLTHVGREVMGVANGSGSQSEEPRLLAQATARALSRFLAPRYRVGIGHVESLPSFSGRGVILVTVLLRDGRKERSLLGSCWSDEGLRRAAVYATLDATNRVFGRLKRRAHIDYEVGSASPPGEVSEAKSF